MADGGEASAVAAGCELIVDLHIKAGQNLKGIAKTVDGAGFAFTHLDLPGKDGDDGAGVVEEKFGNIGALQPYTHLRYVNLSNHLISDPGPLAAMSHLLSLDLSKNMLTSEALDKFKEAPLNFLQVLNLSHNRIEDYSLSFPMLRELYLNNNQLNKVTIESDGSVLKILDLRDNMPQGEPAEAEEGAEPGEPKGLRDCDGFGLSSLETLLVTGNPIASLRGLDGLISVVALDLSGCPVESLDGLPAQGKLATLKLMDCKIQAWEEMDKLTALSTVTDLDVQGNPLPDLGVPLRGRVLFRVPGLQVLNELPISDEDRDAAKEQDPAPPEAA